MSLRNTRTFLPPALLLAVILSVGTVFAFSGAIYTTDKNGTEVNQNIYDLSTDVYISGGPQNHNASGPPDGTYYFQVTDPSGNVLLSTDIATCRQLVVSGGRIAGASPASGVCKHANGTFNPAANGATPVQLSPYSAT